MHRVPTEKRAATPRTEPLRVRPRAGEALVIGVLVLGSSAVLTTALLQVIDLFAGAHQPCGAVIAERPLARDAPQR